MLIISWPEPRSPPLLGLPSGLHPDTSLDLSPDRQGWKGPQRPPTTDHRGTPSWVEGEPETCPLRSRRLAQGHRASGSGWPASGAQASSLGQPSRLPVLYPEWLRGATHHGCRGTGDPMWRDGRPATPFGSSRDKQHPTVSLPGHSCAVAPQMLGRSPHQEDISGRCSWRGLLASSGGGWALFAPHSQGSPAHGASGSDASTPAPSSSVPQILQF